MLAVDHILLKDLLRKSMRKAQFSIEETAEYLKVPKANLDNFLTGRVTEPYREMRDAIESFCEENGFTQNAIARSLAAIGSKRKQPETIRVLKFAFGIIQREIELGKLTRLQFIKETGIPKGTVHSFFRQSFRKCTANTKRMMEWLREKRGLDEQRLKEMMDGKLVTPLDQSELSKMGIKQKPDGAVMSSHVPGKHYLCTFLEDWESAQTIGAIMGCSTLTEAQKRTLIGKLFTQEFPTLS